MNFDGISQIVGEDRYLAIADDQREIGKFQRIAHKHNSLLNDRRKDVWWTCYSIQEFAERANISENRARELDRKWSLLEGYEPMSRKRMSDEEFVESLDFSTMFG